MRVLVTGSAGFIAGHLELGSDEVLDLDLKHGNDVLTSFDVIRDFDPELVFHLAAHHFIPWTEDHPGETTRTNVLGTDAVTAACGPSLQTFVLASSAAVYGFSLAPLDEDSAQVGTGVYARSKQEAEVRLSWFSQKRPDVHCIAARLFNVVGAGDSHAHVLPSIVSRHLAGEPVTVGNTWPQRDYVHVDDVCDALAVLATDAPPGFTVWNVGTGTGTSVGELIQMVGEVTGRKVDAHELYAKARLDDGNLVSDPTRMRELMNWTASRPLRLAVRDAVESF